MTPPYPHALLLRAILCLLGVSSRVWLPIASTSVCTEYSTLQPTHTEMHTACTAVLHQAYFYQLPTVYNPVQEGALGKKGGNE